MQLVDKPSQQSDVKNHVIDRTFVEKEADGKRVRWVIDYKLTDLDKTSTHQNNAEQHRPQLERYAQLFEAEGLPVKKAVLFLSTGQLVELT